MIWLILIVILLICIAILINYISYIQHDLLFEPSRDEILYDKDEYIYKDVYINVYNNKIKKENTYKKHENYIHIRHFNNYKDKPTILFCHGNTGNISHRTYIINASMDLKVNLLLFDYRGYGKSGGIPSKRNIREDGETAYKYLDNYNKENNNNNNIIIWGMSLGGHVASWIASKYKCKSLILLSTFSSLTDIILYKNSYSIFGRLICYLYPIFSDVMPSKKYIRKVKCPIIIIHSHEDEIIPFNCSNTLYKNIKHEKKNHIKIKGKHSLPIITQRQFDQLLKLSKISDKNSDVNKLLDDIKHVVNNYFKINISDSFSFSIINSN